MITLGNIRLNQINLPAKNSDEMLRFRDNAGRLNILLTRICYLKFSSITDKFFIGKNSDHDPEFLNESKETQNLEEKLKRIKQQYLESKSCVTPSTLTQEIDERLDQLFQASDSLDRLKRSVAETSVFYNKELGVSEEYVDCKNLSSIDKFFSVADGLRDNAVIFATNNKLYPLAKALYDYGKNIDDILQDVSGISDKAENELLKIKGKTNFVKGEVIPIVQAKEHINEQHRNLFPGYTQLNFILNPGFSVVGLCGRSHEESVYNIFENKLSLLAQELLEGKSSVLVHEEIHSECYPYAVIAVAEGGIETPKFLSKSEQFKKDVSLVKGANLKDLLNTKTYKETISLGIEWIKLFEEAAKNAKSLHETKRAANLLHRVIGSPSDCQEKESQIVYVKYFACTEELIARLAQYTGTDSKELDIVKNLAKARRTEDYDLFHKSVIEYLMNEYNSDLKIRVPEFKALLTKEDTNRILDSFVDS